MTDRAALWERIHALLDRRADPLEDAELARELCEQPEELRRMLRLRERLERLSSPAANTRTASRLRPLLRAAAATLLLAVGLALWLGPAHEGAGPAPAPESGGTVLRGSSRVLAWRLDITRTAGEHRSTTTNDGRTLTREAHVEPRSGVTDGSLHLSQFSVTNKRRIQQ